MNPAPNNEQTSTAHYTDRPSQPSQTASDYISQQLALEADAKQILPYKFDKCTYDLGPLRQQVFACLTCNPPPASTAQVFVPAGVCYACSISCHSDHELVELFHRRNFVCDCGTTRIGSSTECSLRLDVERGVRGVTGQEASKGNVYNHNFRNRFCGCEEEYDAGTEKGTMYQCIGLGAEGCGEDWWHPECLMGISRNWLEEGTAKAREVKKAEDEQEHDHPVPMGFPEDEEFSTVICYKCVDANPWLKQYAGTPGFLPPLMRQQRTSRDSKCNSDSASVAPSLKRRIFDDDKEESERLASAAKRTKEDHSPSALLGESNTATLEAEDTTLPDTTKTPSPAVNGPPSSLILSSSKHKHELLPPLTTTTVNASFSILAQADFRDHICHCPSCFPNLIPYPQLQDSEDEYEPSLSDSEQSPADGTRSGGRSVGTGSLLDRGEAALSNIDRVRAIEGVMVYNHLRDKVKEFLRPYAESGQAVGAEDIKAYFEKLRGDDLRKGEAENTTEHEDGSSNSGNRREQSGY